MVQMESIARLGLDDMLTRREQLVILEIGDDSIASASSFVDYLCESYAISKSSIWYILKRLKEKEILDFASRNEPGKSLTLTKGGAEKLRLVEKNRSEILNYFGSESTARIGATYRRRELWGGI
ncbi:hypothetical protein M1397_03265 [Candidatus Marsarchaeota archaeon]|nr:hypothetical protein [Candidatus Marsarchaeota archaeon]